MSSRWQGSNRPRGEDYDARWSELEAAGRDPHGEASFVMSFAPTSVLDAGCGTGRVAIELARHGVRCTGVDLDASMLDAARRKAPSLHWIEADLVSVDAREGGPGFDVVVLAGNVMIFLEPESEASVVQNMASHLAVDGVLVAGFSLGADGYRLAELDRDTEALGLELVERWATWDRQPWSPSADYAVSVYADGDE